MAASIARRATLLRNFCRATVKPRTVNHSESFPTSIRSNLGFEQIRSSSRSSPVRLRREALFLSSMLPLHSAVASACLISKLPSEVNTPTGRFAYYVSPI